MSNQDDEPNKDAALPSYQFFSPDLNYNYFTEPTAFGDAPPVVTPAALPSATTSSSVTPTSSTPSSTSSSTPSSVPEFKPYTYVPPAPTYVPPVSNYVPTVSTYVPPTSTYVPPSSCAVPPAPTDVSTAPTDVSPAPTYVAPAINRSESSPSTSQFLANLAAQVALPVVEVEPERVEYSLTEDGPEPTFEERVKAMEEEIAAATKAAAAEAIARVPEETPFLPFQVALEPIPAEYIAAPEQPASTGTQSGQWNAFVEPNRVPDVFSSDFNFNRSLLKIFWRIDIDHNNRVSKNELAQALQENWFNGDEKLLAKLLFESYEDISPEAIFCDAGLSVNNILNFGPFGDMAAAQLEPNYVEPAPPPPTPNVEPKKKSPNKSSQSLRSMFKR